MDADEAIRKWREARPPGIKHAYFCDELRRRYPRDTHSNTKKEEEKEKKSENEMEELKMESGRVVNEVRRRNKA